MSNVTRNSYATGGEGTTPALRVNRQGNLVVIPVKMQWAIEGRVYHISCGTETTPLTAITYDQDQPEFTLAAPTGTTIIPLSVRCTIETSTGTDKEFIIWRTTNAIAAGTSSAVTAGPTNLRSDSPYASLATARQLHTANVTQTDYKEVWRSVTPIASIAPFVYEYAPESPVILVGPASLGCQLSATTTQPIYFLTVTYAEFPTADVT